MPRTRETTGMWTEDVRKAIDLIWKEKGIPPSMREIMQITGITSKSVVSYELRRLVYLGVIKIISGKAVPKWVMNRLKNSSEIP